MTRVVVNTQTGEQVIDGAAPAPPAPDAMQARVMRNTLLVQSDWTQVADAPVDAAAWAAYRQALRDVPAQQGFPDNIVWPAEPQ